jgi:hypothetical protein
VIAALAALAVAMYLVLVVGRSAGEPVLTGSTQFDFGQLDFDGSILKVTHVFSLTNTSDRTVRVEKVVSSCGCAVADVKPRRVLPGQDVAVTAHLTFQTPGYRQALISLVLDGRSPLTLTMSGTARRLHTLYAAQRSLRLDPLAETQITLIATSLGSEVPPSAPCISAQGGVRCAFLGWELVHGLRRDIGRPARWHGAISVIGGAQNPPRGSKLIVEGPGGAVFKVDLTGRSLGS